MASTRTRRQPRPFREVEVTRLESRSPYMTRVTLAGGALAGFEVGLPAASMRLLLPSDSTKLVVPTWTGNEFLAEDGSRPIIRTLTPLSFDPDRLEIDLEIVRHEHGPLSDWADAAKQGDGVAISGPGRGYEIDPSARSFLLAGDESAIPALGVLLAALPPQADVRVFIEVRHLDARLELPTHRGATVQWCLLDHGAPPGDSIVSAVQGARPDPGTKVWAAGEAASMQRIRRHLFEEVRLTRSNAVVRGYWKHGRRSDSGA